MTFSSTIFLFLFLPLVLFLSFITPKNLRNSLLLLFSIIFYAWGEQFYVAVILISIGINYLAGWGMNRWTDNFSKKIVLSTAIIFNLGLLILFKYANFIVDNLNILFIKIQLPPWQLSPIHLPIGISFFTFKGLSYIIDVYRGDIKAQKNPIQIALSLSFFPYQIAGPIVRFRDIATQLISSVISRTEFAIGVSRFIIGLGKKMIIANTVAVPADRIFALPADELTCGLTWLGITCYTLQIYFDFSGYSDMAIGIGHMFGFRFKENFNYPYISQSITEFWRRWHISLSNWFRDYLYIPMGGNRCHPWRVYFNLISVFFLCGLWHGASWNFIFWGLFHGSFLIFERIMSTNFDFFPFPPLKHVYTILVIFVGWVFFRSDTVYYAMKFIFIMSGLSKPEGLAINNLFMFVDLEVLIAIMVGVLGSTPLASSFYRWILKQTLSFSDRMEKSAFSISFQWIIHLSRVAILAAILLISSLKLASSTYNPFIYFRF